MKKNKAFVLITAVVAFFAFAGLAFGANQGTVTVTSEPIEQGVACSKGGGFVIEFDSGTVLAHGDQITLDLDLGVTLCTDIDSEISGGGSGGTWGSQLFDGAAPPVVDAPVVDPTAAATSHLTDGGVYFRISGTDGSARITIDVIGVDVDGDLTNNAALTVGGGVDDKLIIYFLDQQTNDDFATDGIYVEGLVADTYDVAAVVADNTICVDVSLYSENTVDANLDSKDDKFTFIPSDPQVAHIIAAKAYRLRACKDATTENIVIGETGGEQGVDTCDAIDFEEGANYCDAFEGRLIIESQSAAFDQSNYEITLEILVNDQEGELGVYWTNEAVNADGYDTLDDACAIAAPLAQLVGAQGSYTYYDENDATVAAATIPVPNAGDCDVDVEDRAVVLVTDSSTLSLDASNDFLWIDMPALNYDLNQIVEGDVVSVRVTLTKAPCTQVYQGTISLGTFGCAEEVLGANGLIYPYFTPMSDTADNYWDGIAIVNLGAVDGTATLYIYEQDGDQASMQVSVAANSMYVNLLSGMVSGMTLNQTMDGTLGNSRCYIIVCTDFVADGFAMIANALTGESMGYLPRQPILAPAICNGD